MIVFKTIEVDFYTNIVLSDYARRQLFRCRIWRYGERTLPSMRTALFLGFFTSDHRSRSGRSDVFKVPKIVKISYKQMHVE